MQTTAEKNNKAKGVVLPATRNIGVVGSRTLGYEYAEKVGAITLDLIQRGFHIATGGALGADQFCAMTILEQNLAHKCVIFSAWQNFKGFPVNVRSVVRQIQELGGSILWGNGSELQPHSLIKLALLQRNQRLVQACYGLVAFLAPGSRGTMFTLSKALQARLPVVVFPVQCELPEFAAVKWVALRCGGCWDNGFKAVYLR